MSTVDQLTNLAALKRQATTIDTLTTYANALYHAAGIWAPEAPAGICILIIDGIVDAIAREEVAP